mmetsp:Transcript_30374/g.56197  ORF Transcript_30374/g.56197 Transcript_30374/m.56197 type:complete len:242 (+) Transcript_30374:241-966(+)
MNIYMVGGLILSRHCQELLVGKLYSGTPDGRAAQHKLVFCAFQGVDPKCRENIPRCHFTIVFITGPTPCGVEMLHHLTQVLVSHRVTSSLFGNVQNVMDWLIAMRIQAKLMVYARQLPHFMDFLIIAADVKCWPIPPFKHFLDSVAKFAAIQLLKPMHIMGQVKPVLPSTRFCEAIAPSERIKISRVIATSIFGLKEACLVIEEHIEALASLAQHLLVLLHAQKSCCTSNCSIRNVVVQCS